MKTSLLVFSLLLLSPFLAFQGYKPKAGYVPDSVTAVKIAEAVLIPVYGEKQVTSERPFHASLKDGVWFVDGTLHCPGPPAGRTDKCDGGVAMVQISKEDGRILTMGHGK
jgi:NTF2 fold immunity protein of polymorphic toxin system component